MIEIGEEVRSGLEDGRAVVALESTVLAHGLPRPRNLEVGKQLEAAVRSGGAVPATIAVVRGVPKVGLSPGELEHIASAEGVRKLSTRDLPGAVARREDGATTVAATMWLARRAGVEVFATGGIGGVHRGVPRDVSADLTELSRTPVVVVCAGPKAVLDLEETREALETAGVLVAGWGTDEMPAFYSRRSGIDLDLRVDTASEVAALWLARSSLGLPGALLLCVPPPEESAIPADEIQDSIGRALREAAASGVKGKEITPFLLSALARITGGRSLETNIALLLNNARVAAAVAVELAAR